MRPTRRLVRKRCCLVDDFHTGHRGFIDQCLAVDLRCQNLLHPVAVNLLHARLEVWQREWMLADGGTSNAVTGLQLHPQGEKVRDMRVDSMTLQHLNDMMHSCKLVMIDHRRIVALAIKHRSVNTNYVDTKLGPAGSGHFQCALIHITDLVTCVDRPESDRLAIPQLELISDGLNEARFAGDVFVQTAQVQQGDLLNGSASGSNAHQPASAVPSFWPGFIAPLGVKGIFVNTKQSMPP